jgi:acyl-homoserine lactone acylase PvdQ
LLDDAHRMLSGLAAPLTPRSDERASNVFAIGPNTQREWCATLANDPHLSLTAPGPLYAVHLSVPGQLDVAGRMCAGMPIIVSSGRNRRCAWGITASGADVMDVYADTLPATAASAVARRVGAGARKSHSPCATACSG